MKPETTVQMIPPSMVANMLKCAEHSVPHVLASYGVKADEHGDFKMPAVQQVRETIQAKMKGVKVDDQNLVVIQG